MRMFCLADEANMQCSAVAVVAMSVSVSCMMQGLRHGGGDVFSAKWGAAFNDQHEQFVGVQ